jgi:DNA-binding MarR family transcriptional regulator
MRSSKQSLSKSGRVVVWFAAHPEMQMTSREISRKFDIPSLYVSSGLAPLVKVGLVSKSRHPEDGRQRIYSAGPSLLENI